MKGELTILKNLPYGAEEFEVRSSFSSDFDLVVYVDKKKTLEKQLKNKKKFNECIKRTDEFMEEQDCPERSDGEKFAIANFDTIYDNIEYIRPLFEDDSVLEFIKENPMVLDKKILLDIRADMSDYDKIVGLMEKHKDHIDKIYVSMLDNNECVSITDCFNTMKKIKEQADVIESLNLSPMETIMYTYDLVRSRVYKLEDENEGINASRDLTNVVLGDKIVCEGYAKLFHAYLYYLGIKSNVVYLNKKNAPIGHARNAIYVKDDKYDIDGLYYFDPTWDSKKGDNNKYLYSYKFFAKTKEQIHSDKFIEKNLQDFSEDILDEIEQILEDGEYEKLEPYYKTINNMSYMINKGQVINIMTINPISPFYGKLDPEKIMDETTRLFYKFNNPIPAETMIRLLNNVRKMEYYLDPNFVPYGEGVLYSAFMNSNWEFDEPILSKEAKLFYTVFREDLSTDDLDKLKTHAFKNFIAKENLAEDIGRVRVARTLRLVCDKKRNETNN